MSYCVRSVSQGMPWTKGLSRRPCAYTDGLDTKLLASHTCEGNGIMYCYGETKTRQFFKQNFPLEYGTYTWKLLEGRIREICPHFVEYDKHFTISCGEIDENNFFGGYSKCILHIDRSRDQTFWVGVLFSQGKAIQHMFCESTSANPLSCISAWWIGLLVRPSMIAVDSSHEILLSYLNQVKHCFQVQVQRHPFGLKCSKQREVERCVKIYKSLRDKVCNQ